MNFPALLLPFFLITSTPAQEAEIRIRSIHVESRDVFDHREFDAWYYHWANRLHIKTRSSFIRRELLLKKGSLMNEDLLKESERNLRRYGFFSNAQIEAVPVNSSESDLHVRTEDQWTLEMSLSYGRSRGAQTYDFGFQENNFLGLGRKIGLKSEQNEERRSLRGNYSEPRFLGRELRLAMSASTASDGYQHTASLAQPFYTEATRWSFGINWDNLKKDEYLYFKGSAAARQQLTAGTAVFTLQHAWGPRYRKVFAGIFLSYEEVLYPGDAEILDPDSASQDEIARNLNPPDRRISQYGPTAGFNFQNYTTRSYLDGYGVTEDLPYGALFNAALLVAENREGSNYTHFVLGGRFALAPGDSFYLALSTESGIRRQSEIWNNLFFKMGLRGYLQHGPASLLLLQSPRQTFAWSLSATLTRDMDLPFQISLGENEGLRGYSFKSFTGTNRVLLNVEERIFTPLENNQLGLAVVPFMDAGGAWGGGNNWDGGVSLGVGLRLGIKKLRRNHIVRIDFAWPLTDGKDRGLSVSFSSGQIFRAL